MTFSSFPISPKSNYFLSFVCFHIIMIRRKNCECPKIEAQTMPNITQIRKQLSSHFMINLFDGIELLFPLAIELKIVNALPIVLLSFWFRLFCRIYVFPIKYPQRNCLDGAHCKRRIVDQIDVWFVENVIRIQNGDDGKMLLGLLSKCFNWERLE